LVGKIRRGQAAVAVEQITVRYLMGNGFGVG
jgi:hypothetical protein